jgi:hypothetical protein
VGLHAIRKTFATVLCKVDRTAAMFALGHSGMRVIDRYVQEDNIVPPGIRAIPQPAAFTKT